MADIGKREGKLPVQRAGQTAPRYREWDPFERMRDLMGWDPFQEVSHTWRGSDLAPGSGMTHVPAFDVRETRSAYLFQADVPGLREEDIDISMAGNRLTISGKREAEATDDADTFYCCERSFGSFTRTFTLPEGTCPDQVAARLIDGVLTVHVPKSPDAQPRRISLKRGHGVGKAHA